jgi:large subunit ribosomal protein L21e
MTQRTGGSRKNSRGKLRKHPRDCGKVKITKLLARYAVGDRVIVDMEPAIQRGMTHVRFHGKHGTITGKQGACYKVLIHDMNKEKVLIVAPVHIKRA